MPRGRILVRDDQQQSLARIFSALAGEGFEVAGATSDVEAVSKLESGSYDLLILNTRAPRSRTGTLAAEKEIDPQLSILVMLKPKGFDKVIGVLSGFAPRLVTLNKLPETLNQAINQAHAMRESAKAEIISPLVKVGESLAKEEPSQILQAIVDKLAEEIAADQAWVMLWDSISQELSTKYTFGVDAQTGTTQRGAESMARWVVKEKQPLALLDNRTAAPEIQQEIAAQGIGSAFCLPLSVGNNLIGVVSFIKLQGTFAFTQYEMYSASALSSTLALALENSRLYEQIQNEKVAVKEYTPQLEQRQQEVRALNNMLQSQQAKVMELNEAHRSLGDRYLATLSSLVATVEGTEPGQSHSDRVVRWIIPLAEAMELTTDGLAEAAYLYDIGMFAPHSVSASSTVPAKAEQEVESHSILAERLAENAGLSPEVRSTIRHHHENYDGSGYPDKLAGDRIPISARLLRVVDSYDEMVTGSPNKAALDQKSAVAKLKAGSDREYDPEVVKAFIGVLGVGEVRPEVQLASTLSHELRSPLTFLVGYSELLASQEGLPDSAKAQATELHAEAVHMSAMVEDLLNLSRIESGRVELKFDEADLAELAKRSVTKAAMTSSLHQLETNISQEPLMAKVDADKILQVLDNLLTNAIRYSPEGGKIVVAVEPMGEQVLVSVTDQGIGIPEDKLEAVFEQFYRVDSPLKHTVQGTGLGLALCQRIVEAHNGRIWVKSKEGEGSTFYFVIPR